jgi:hypothetical protein
MHTVVDESSSAYQSGQLIGRVVVATAVVILVVWLVRRRRATPAGPVIPDRMRTPELDMTVLATVLTIQAAHDAATALVTRALVQHPLLERVDSALPTWCLSGGHPYVTLIPTPAGSVLRVQEVEVPLPSPQPAVVWEWALAEVQQEADRARIPTYRAQQALAPARPVGPHTTIWAAVG